MQRARFTAAPAAAAVLIAAAGAVGVSAQTATYAPMSTTLPATKPGGAMAPLPAASLALDARYLLGRRTATGYTLTGQALVKDACTAARFDQFLGNIFPPQFNLNQFRRPGTQGLLCIQRLTWVTATPKSVVSAAPPRYVTVRTKKGFTRVPILPGPSY
jgi:hypothetical protein